MTKTIRRARTLPPLPEIDDVTRREFLIGAAGLLLLPAGCGGDGGREGEASGDTRTVEHVRGTVDVPADPQRVVLDDTTFSLDSTYALGVVPVGAPDNTGVTTGVLELVRDEGEEISSIGGGAEPSVERTAALEPDLIIGFEGGPADSNYRQFSEIAPTAIIEFGDQTAWKHYLRDVAQVLGRETKAERLLLDWEERVEAFRREMGHRLEETTVSIAYLYPDGRAEYRDLASFPGSVVEEAGLRRPEAQRTRKAAAEVSAEEIDRLDADVMFLCVGPGSEDTIEEYVSNPLWSRLEVAKKDRVHRVDADAWLFGTILAANSILDDLEWHLLNGAEGS